MKVDYSRGTEFLVEIGVVVVCTVRVVKMKEHLLFYREISILCIGDRVADDRIV